jgi:hypothetical protein
MNYINFTTCCEKKAKKNVFLPTAVAKLQDFALKKLQKINMKKKEKQVLNPTHDN